MKKCKSRDAKIFNIRNAVRQNKGPGKTLESTKFLEPKLGKSRGHIV
jgi:hypothetical protein